MEPEERLANAIVEQAVRDYVMAWIWLRKNPTWMKSSIVGRDRYNSERKRMEGTAAEVEEFFCSKWFGVLSALNGRELFRRIQHECRNSETFRNAWMNRKEI